MAGVTEIAFDVDTSQVFDLIQGQIQRDNGNLVGAQQPAHNLAKSSNPGHDHWRLLLDHIGFPLLIAGFTIPRQDQPVVGNKQQRRQEHGQRHHQSQKLGDVRGDHAVLHAVGQQHEAEFAGLGQPEGEQPAITAPQPE